MLDGQLRTLKREMHNADSYCLTGRKLDINPSARAVLSCILMGEECLLAFEERILRKKSHTEGATLISD